MGSSASYGYDQQRELNRDRDREDNVVLDEIVAELTDNQLRLLIDRVGSKLRKQIETSLESKLKDLLKYVTLR